MGLQAPVYEFFNPSLTEEQLGQRLSGFNSVSISDVLARYKRQYTLGNHSPVEQRAQIHEFMTRIDANEHFYKVG